MLAIEHGAKLCTTQLFLMGLCNNFSVARIGFPSQPYRRVLLFAVLAKTHVREQQCFVLPQQYWGLFWFVRLQLICSIHYIYNLMPLYSWESNNKQHRCSTKANRIWYRDHNRWSNSTESILARVIDLYGCTYEMECHCVDGYGLIDWSVTHCAPNRLEATRCFIVYKVNCCLCETALRNGVCWEY